MSKRTGGLKGSESRWGKKRLISALVELRGRKETNEYINQSRPTSIRTLKAVLELAKEADELYGRLD